MKYHLLPITAMMLVVAVNCPLSTILISVFGGVAAMGAACVYIKAKQRQIDSE